MTTSVVELRAASRMLPQDSSAAAWLRRGGIFIAEDAENIR